MQGINGPRGQVKQSNLAGQVRPGRATVTGPDPWDFFKHLLTRSEPTQPVKFQKKIDPVGCLVYHLGEASMSLNNYY